MLTCISIALVLSGTVGGQDSAPQTVSPPNVVLILADDLGIGDLGCYNAASKIPTPHLDGLAQGGTRFTDAHSPSAVCTPTRYGLLTGRYAWRTRLKSGVHPRAARPADVHHSVGFTARVRGRRTRDDWRKLVPGCLPIGSSADQRLALVFGNEVTGLTSAETDLCNELAHVRTSSEHTSLNLGMCVGIALADLFTGTKVHAAERGGSMLDGEGREFLKARLREVFADGVVRPGTPQVDVEEMIERVFSRAALQNKDARAWHLILKTLGSQMSPSDLDLTLHEKGGRRREAMARRVREGQGGPEEGEGASQEQEKG